jgi:hypothetical protein
MGDFLLAIFSDDDDPTSPLVQIVHRSGLILLMNSEHIYMASECCQVPCHYREMRAGNAIVAVYCGNCKQKLFESKVIEASLYKARWNQKLVLFWFELYGLSYFEALVENNYLNHLVLKFDYLYDRE